VQDVAIGNWLLKHVAGDRESVYKFHRNIQVKAQQTVTVSVVDLTGDVKITKCDKQMLFYFFVSCLIFLLESIGNFLAILP